MAKIIGIANKKNLTAIEARDREKVFPFVFPILCGIASPIKIKFTILKTVPRIKPLPRGLWPARIKKKPAKIAAVIALEQYFF